jgi:Cof subfamily protein (haloacid dehalogenase superfamily)
MPKAMRHLQSELGILTHPLICYNGGYVIHHATPMGAPHVIDSVEIPHGICASILELVSSTSIHVSLYFEDDWYAPQADSWTLREAKITKVEPVITAGEKVLEMWESGGNGAHKVMLMGEPSQISTIEKELTRLYGSNIHVYYSKSSYLEIAPGAVSKASALERLLRDMYEIPLQDVIAFGDNFNDIALLQSAGLGIAVGNARDEVKKAAGEITAKNIDDGVAISIEKHFNLDTVAQ